MPRSTNGYGCAGKSPRLGSFLPSFSRRVRRSLPLHLFSLRRVCKLLSLLEEAIKKGRGKKPRYPLPRKTPKAKGESEDMAREEQKAVGRASGMYIIKVSPFSSMDGVDGGSYHHLHHQNPPLPERCLDACVELIPSFVSWHQPPRRR